MVRVGPVPVNVHATQSSDHNATNPRTSTRVATWAQPRSSDSATRELRHSLRMQEISKKWKTTTSTNRRSHSPGGATATRITERTSQQSPPNAHKNLDRSPLPPLQSAYDSLDNPHSMASAHAQEEGNPTSSGGKSDQSNMKCNDELPSQLPVIATPDKEVLRTSATEKAAAPLACDDAASSGSVDIGEGHDKSDLEDTSNVVVSSGEHQAQRRVLYIQSFLTFLCLTLLVVVMLAAASDSNVVRAINMAEATFAESVANSVNKVSLGLIYIVLEGPAANSSGTDTFSSDLCYSEAAPFFVSDAQCDDCERAGKAACGIILLAMIVNILRADISVNRHAEHQQKHAVSFSVGAILSSLFLVLLDSIVLGLLWSWCMKRLRDDPAISTTFGNAFVIASTVLLIDSFQLILHLIFI